MSQGVPSANAHADSTAQATSTPSATAGQDTLSMQQLLLYLTQQQQQYQAQIQAQMQQAYEPFEFRVASRGEQKKKDPPVYEGRFGEDIELWIFATEQNYANKRHLMAADSSDFVTLISSNLGKSVLNCGCRGVLKNISSETQAECAGRESWLALSADIRGRYHEAAPLSSVVRPKDFEYDLRERLFYLKQKETTHEHFSKLQDLMSQTELEISELENRFFFQNGLREGTAKKIKEESPNTLQEAIEIPSNFEFAHYSGRPPRVPAKSFKPVPTESGHRANKSRPHKAKRFEKKNDKNDDWTKTATCQNCGVVGHISPQCKAPKRKEANRYIGREAQAFKDVGRERHGTVFIDNGCSLNGVSEALVKRLELEVTGGEMMQVDLGYDQVVHRPRRTVHMNLQIPGFPLTSGIFQVMPVPENKDVIIGMMWLRDQNPDIDWSTGRMTPCINTEYLEEVQQRLPKQRPAGRVAGRRRARVEQSREIFNYYRQQGHHGRHGTTRLISSQQFLKMLRHDKDIEAVFVSNPHDSEKAERFKSQGWETLKGNPAYITLRKYANTAFRTELPNETPPAREGIEHEILLKPGTKPISFKQWRQSPEQRTAIQEWTKEMVQAGIIRPSTSAFSAPTFCVKKPIGWHIVHDYRQLNLATILPAIPMPRKEYTFDAMSRDFVGRKGVRIDPDKMMIIAEWPVPKTMKQMERFLGTTVYVSRFCKDYAQFAGPLHDSIKGKRPRDAIELSDDQLRCFNELKNRLMSPLVLSLPDFSKSFGIRMDASNFAIGGVLFQKEGELEHPIAFTGRKMKPAELNYPVREQELLAIMHALRVWRVYLLDCPFTVETDHKNIAMILTQKTTNRSAARWFNELAEFPPMFKRIPGETNTVADVLSRNPDFERKTGQVSWQELLDAARNREIVATIGTNKLTVAQTAKTMYSWNKDLQWIIKKLKQGVCVCQNTPCKMVYYTTKLAKTILHDCHPGFYKTYLVIREKYYWPKMMKYIQRYVNTCEMCQRNKARQTKPPGLLQPLDIPKRRRTDISMEFVVSLPVSTNGNNAIMVIVDRLTKRLKCISMKTIDATTDIADVFMKNYVKDHGLPKTIVSDRDTKFTSKLWQSIVKALGTQHNLSSPFRPQTDGQTERTNRFIGDYLRGVINPAQNDWDDYLHLAEFAYNRRVHSTIGISPFEADLGYVLYMPDDVASDPEFIKLEKSAREFLLRQETRHKVAQDRMRVAQERMKFYYDKNRLVQNFEVNDMVLLDEKNLDIRHKRYAQSKKLAPRYIRPFPVLKNISKDCYELKISKGLKFHPVFRTLLLKPYRKHQSEGSK
ncbi:unnamed protein product [Phytophthora fragariaefolia]|uniref:RNA-directed DNA polymerase n=1 Tax=Phytophthora fragariaefolia TaxID=1490495 RepID=A0A9W6TN88_9STRA|nr:unnamed protein product [Phytophthora fragariaefolia]